MKTILISGTNENLQKIADSICDKGDKVIRIEDLIPSSSLEKEFRKLAKSGEIFAVTEAFFGLPNSKFSELFEKLKGQKQTFDFEIKLVLVTDCKPVDLRDYFQNLLGEFRIKLTTAFIFNLPQISLTESFDFENELLNLKNAISGSAEQFSASKNKVTIYTDGACSVNPGKGGWGAILISGSKEKKFSGYAENTTNNQMELTAVIKALEALKRDCEVELYSDSAYVVNAINNNWLEGWKNNGWIGSDKKPVKNQPLWERLDELLSRHKVHFNKVKGHADNEYNNRCDKLATGEISKHS